MYKELGKFGCINIRSITYMEDRLEDRRLGYKWAFDLELLPCVKISNHYSRVSITMRWLNWELIWFKYELKKA